MNIGIIGTAGRKEDAPLINPTLYSQMVDVVLKLVVLQDKVLSNHPDPITLVSGGAAVADHIAVQLALAEPKYKLKLHLPASFVIAQKQYACVPNNIFAPANVANYYHRNFSKSCQINSLEELARIIEAGADVVVTPGFKQRNTQVAQDSDMLIALTFGKGPVLKVGGTLDTFNKFISLKPKAPAYHIDLHTMQLFKIQ